VAAFLAARGAYGPFTRRNWVRFLDASATIIYPDGSRRYALVRTRLSHGICGMRPTKGVVFDFGGVMTSSTMPARVKGVTDAFGIDWESLASGFEKYRRIMDADFMTMEEMYELIWADADIDLPEDVRARIVAEDYASFMEESRNEKTLQWMRSLKDAGYKIGILSNMSTDMFERFRKTYADFIAVADAMVISGQERMFKPQKRIYDLMKKRLGLHSDELCFVDDVEGNCEGARRSGWHAIRFESVEQAQRDFAERFA
jgi:epoxide hydrolase-like predicted phosphatase